MSNGDRWDRSLKPTDKTRRQRLTEINLILAARALVDGVELSEEVRLALAESLFRIAAGEDPRDCFGPIKGPRKRPQGLKLDRDTIAARQLHYIKKLTPRGNHEKAAAYVGSLRHIGTRTVEDAYTKHRDSSARLWRLVESGLIDPSNYLPAEHLDLLQDFLQKTTR
jgi:hypothetical protein